MCVTFYFKDIDGSFVHTTIPVEDFISSLIQHILPPQFRKVRYYGALSNKNRTHFIKLITKQSHKTKQTQILLSWRERIKLFTSKDPFIYPICQKEFTLVEVAYFSKKQNCLDIYELSP